MHTLKFFQLFYFLFNKNPKPNLEKIQKMGLLAVKIGQMYALRSDFIDPEKCRHLRKLYQATTPIPSQNFEDLFQEHAPERLKNDIKNRDKEPLAAASIGQVHRATLKNGDKVVIKIIKDNFEDAFLKDVRAVRRLLKVIVFFYPKLKKVADPLGTLATIEHQTLTELDLRNEIKGIKKLNEIKQKHLKSSPFLKNLQFPTCYPEYSNRHILVSQEIEGHAFDTLLSEKKLQYDNLLNLFRIHGLYIFLIGTFHGDLHPGNIFLKNSDIYFLDNSNVEKVPPSFGKGIATLLFHLSNADYKKGAQTLHEISRDKLPTKKYKAFEKKFVELYEDFDGKTVSEVSLTNQMMKTVKMAINTGMSFEEGMFAVIKSLMYLDGMVKQCKPDAILLKDVAQFKEDLKG